MMYAHLRAGGVRDRRDERRGETVKALVVLRDAFKEAQVSRRSSSTGATNTWPPTKARASCSWWTACPKSAASAVAQAAGQGATAVGATS